MNFESPEGCFAAYLPPDVLRAMLQVCSIAGRKETGGILVGCYEDEGKLARLTGISVPPKDSLFGFAQFSRGTNGLRSWLQQLWEQPERSYYVGEWHFHPGRLPEFSPLDAAEMASISRRSSYHCPNPLLIIVGGRLPKSWKLSVYVFDNPSGLIRLDELALGNEEQNYSATDP